MTAFLLEKPGPGSSSANCPIREKKGREYFFDSDVSRQTQALFTASTSGLIIPTWIDPSESAGYVWRYLSMKSSMNADRSLSGSRAIHEPGGADPAGKCHPVSIYHILWDQVHPDRFKSDIGQPLPVLFRTKKAVGE